MPDFGRSDVGQLNLTPGSQLVSQDDHHAVQSFNGPGFLQPSFQIKGRLNHITHRRCGTIGQSRRVGKNAHRIGTAKA